MFFKPLFAMYSGSFPFVFLRVSLCQGKVLSVICFLQGQLTYCLLYLCQSMILCQRKSENKKSFERQLVGYCLLALEMSRHRTTALVSDISNTESSWLLRLEVSVCDYLEGVVGSAHDAVCLYLDALTTVGITFYEGCYPLVLTDMLLYLYIKVGAEHK